MTTRVTHRSIQESTMARLQGNLQGISKLQDQVSSGKRIQVPSDDPSGTVTALAVRQQQRLNEQYERASQDGVSWLAVQDTALQTASSQLRRAESLVVSSLNSTVSANQSSRTANGVEIDGITATIKSLMNSQYLGRNVFAGTSGVQDAVQPAPGGGYTFADTGTGGGTVTRQVDSANVVRVDTDGRVVFGDDATAADDQSKVNVLTLLEKISAEVKSPSDTDGTALRGMYATLQDRLGKVLEAAADVGARTNRIEQAQSVAASSKVTLAQQLSDVEDTDVPAALVNLSLQTTAYQSALKANAKVLQVSLMDFLN